ncbi:MAG: isoprenylcysteine carboxylmethyltransferase family protein [Nitrososphaerota archaeon]|nr:isoprenylcysteine carboxylmethyltransferase family protein [Nitrososphaerota archaeon]
MSAKDKRAIEVPAPLVFIAFLLLGYVFNLLLPIRFSAPRTPIVTLGVIFLVSAVLLAVSAFREMRKAGTSPNPAKLPIRLVVDGPFSFTRNPIYISFALGYTGIALIFETLWSLPFLAIALILVDRLIVAKEEQLLKASFGEDYARYKSKVRRWI